MQYIFRVNEQKELLTSNRVRLFKNESNSDQFVFIVPVEMIPNIATCSAYARIITPAQSGLSYVLTNRTEYAGDPAYAVYTLVADANITAANGAAEIWMSFIDTASSSVMKTASTYFSGGETKNIEEYFTPAQIQQMDALALRVAALESGKADGLVYTSPSTLQLQSGASPVGNTVNIEDSNKLLWENLS